VDSIASQKVSACSEASPLIRAWSSIGPRALRMAIASGSETVNVQMHTYTRIASCIARYTSHSTFSFQTATFAFTRSWLKKERKCSPSGAANRHALLVGISCSSSRLGKTYRIIPYTSVELGTLVADAIRRGV